MLGFLDVLELRHSLRFLRTFNRFLRTLNILKMLQLLRALPTGRGQKEKHRDLKLRRRREIFL